MTALASPSRPRRRPSTRRRSFMLPAESAAVEERIRLYVWQVPVRVTHWVTAGCIVVLSVTGVLHRRPVPHPAGRLGHDDDPPGPHDGRVHPPRVRPPADDLAARRQPLRPLVGVHPDDARPGDRALPAGRLLRLPAQGDPARSSATTSWPRPAYLVLSALLLVETVTGFALDGLLGSEPGATGFGWVRELVGPQIVRLVHHLSMWAILAIALFHVYSCVLVDHLEKNGLLSSIVSGFKYPSREEIVESRDGGPELLETVHEPPTIPARCRSTSRPRRPQRSRRPVAASGSAAFEDPSSC